MTYLNHIKKNRMHESCRWIVKTYKEYPNKIKEIKLIFNPEEYAQNKDAKKLLNQDELIKILENDNK